MRYATDISMHSEELDCEVLYSIYLPADYAQEPDKRYGVVYLVHGYGDDHKAWNDKWLNITSIIDSKERSGQIEPMIYVMPQGFKSYYVNRYDGKFDYMDMFIEELVPYIDNSYRTVADRDHRAIVGYSMGGFGAMILASKNQSTFSLTAPLSISFRTDEQYMTESQNGWNGQWGAIFGGVGESGEGRLTDYYKEHSPLHYFNEQSASDFSQTKFYIDCGDDEEQLLVANDSLHVLLRDIGVEHQFRVRNGAHTSTYWREAMDDVLPYINAHFTNVPLEPTFDISLNETFDGDCQTKSYEDSECRIYHSAGFDTQEPQCAIYLLHEGMSNEELNSTVNLLRTATSNRNYIVVTLDGSSVESVEALIDSVEKDYNISNHLAIARGCCGKALYEYSLKGKLSALYLFDADSLDAEPNSETKYYISLGDMGEYYHESYRLYCMCHAKGLTYEYRTRDGESDFETFCEGFAEFKSTIIENINQ